MLAICKKCKKSPLDNGTDIEMNTISEPPITTNSLPELPTNPVPTRTFDMPRDDSMLYKDIFDLLYEVKINKDTSPV